MSEACCPVCSAPAPAEARSTLVTCAGCRVRFLLPGASNAPLVTSAGLPVEALDAVTITDPFRQRFALGQLLGAGGMGAVYAATDAEGRAVAIKFLLRPGDEGLLARFVREGRLAVKLKHPNLIAVHEVGELGGVPYIVMERVDGETLQARLNRGRMPSDEAARVIGAVLAGLQACHAQGVVHRDIKPSNVLLGADGVPRLADLGIAKDYGQGDSLVTETGALLGTPVYMAPEQVRGEPASTATDVYQAGVMLHEMLAGQPPFADTNRFALMERHQRQPPPPLPADVPAKLAAVVMRALAKAPGARFAVAEDMAQAVRAAVAPVAAAATPRPAREETSRWMLGIAVVAVALAATVVEGMRPATMSAKARGASRARLDRVHPAWAYRTLIPRRIDAPIDPEELACTDGRHLVSLSRSGNRLEVYDLETGRRVRRTELRGQSDRTFASHDGRWVAGLGTRMDLCDGLSGDCRELLRCERYVFGMTFSENGAALAAAGPEGVCTWEVGDTLNFRRNLKLKGGAHRAVFSPRGDLIAAFARRRLTVLDALTGQLRFEQEMASHDSTSVAFSRDGLGVAAAMERSIAVVDLDAGKLLVEHRVSPAYFRELRFRPDGRLLAFVHEPGSSQIQIEEFVMHTRPPQLPVVQTIDDVTSWPVVSPDGTTVVCTRRDGCYVWRL